MLSGIDQAESVGLSPVKINMVVIKGLNEDEVKDFAINKNFEANTEKLNISDHDSDFKFIQQKLINIIEI